MDRLNKKDLVDLISERHHLTKVESRKIVDEMLQAIEDTLVAGEEVNFSNFGVLVPITRQTRVGTDPKKHTKITIQKTRTISFRAAKQLKAKLNK